MTGKPTVTYSDFEKLHIAAGKVVGVQPFERARTPTYKVQVDFGEEQGLRWSTVQARSEYTEAEMLGRMVVAILNLPAKNVAGFQSEVLILGVPAEDGSLSLLEPSRGALLGASVY